MGERKLAHIEKIEWIRPVEGADKIDLCGVLGWQCVIAKKDNFKVGDIVVYCEVDSVMPEKPEYEFLRERKFRIRTIKLRGELSQGLILPLSILGKNRPAILSIGDDVTDLLEIRKYLTPTEKEEISEAFRQAATEKNRFKKFMMRYHWYRKWRLTHKQRSKFPYWISKTDEERIQNMPRVITNFADEKVYVTEKLDGQSATFTGQLMPFFKMFDGKVLSFLNWIFPPKYNFIVCSRNLVVGKDSLYWQMAKKYDLENVLKKNPNLTIQAEQCGPKIQGNKYGLKENDIYVFNIINHKDNYHFDYGEMESFCQTNRLKVVPYLYCCYLGDFIDVPGAVERSRGQSKLADVPREGIVVRVIKKGKKVLSFKCINPDFLLKFD